MFAVIEYLVQVNISCLMENVSCGHGFQLPEVLAKP